MSLSHSHVVKKILSQTNHTYRYYKYKTPYGIRTKVKVIIRKAVQQLTRNCVTSILGNIKKKI